MTAAALNNRFATQIDSSCVQRMQRAFVQRKKKSVLIFINQIGLRMKFNARRVSLFDWFISRRGEIHREKRGSDAIEARARTRRKSPAHGNHPAIARRCRQRVCYTFSTNSYRFHIRPQLGHYFSNYNFHCAFGIHGNSDSWCRINPRSINPELCNIDKRLSVKWTKYFHMQEIQMMGNR